MLTLRAVVFGTLIWLAVIAACAVVIWTVDWVLSMIFGLR